MIDAQIEPALPRNFSFPAATGIIGDQLLCFRKIKSGFKFHQGFSELLGVFLLLSELAARFLCNQCLSPEQDQDIRINPWHSHSGKLLQATRSNFNKATLSYKGIPVNLQFHKWRNFSGACISHTFWMLPKQDFWGLLFLIYSFFQGVRQNQISARDFH